MLNFPCIKFSWKKVSCFVSSYFGFLYKISHLIHLKSFETQSVFDAKTIKTDNWSLATSLIVLFISGLMFFIHMILVIAYHRDVACKVWTWGVVLKILLECMIVCCDLMIAEDLCNKRPEVEDIGEVNEDCFCTNNKWLWIHNFMWSIVICIMNFSFPPK